jgi:hypothetical protein
MFIVPYYLKGNTAWIFMRSGSIWETDEKIMSKEAIIAEYLEPNGLYGTGSIVNGYMYFQINDKTKLTDFYSWEEYLDGGVEDYWRPFFWSDDWKDEMEGFIKDFWKYLKEV